MRIRTLTYFFREASSNLKRNNSMSLASVGTVMVTLTILGMLFLALANLYNITNTVESKVEMRVFIREGVSEEERQAIGEKISKVVGIKKVQYVSRDTALRRLKKQLGENADLVKIIGENPLPDSYQIRVNDTSELKAIADVVTTFAGVEEVNYGQDFVDKLMAVSRLLMAFTIFSSIAAVTAVLFIIVNTIKITVFSRRREIEIMKLVGATDWFIRWPFILEGAIIGLFGGTLSVLTCAGVYKLATAKMYSSAPFIPIIFGGAVLGDLALIIVPFGMVIGVIGSAISIRKFLHV